MAAPYRGPTRTSVAGSAYRDAMPDDLSDFTCTPFCHEGRSREVYRSGTGPAVIVMAEIPGITPAVAAFSRRVRDLGCTVVLPVLFGEPGKDPGTVYMARSLVPACVSKEFAAFATGRTAPVTEWLRALARDAHAACGGPGVGAVGMCFTGGFALGMMAGPEMIAPVLSQPSLPIGFTGSAKSSLHLSDEDLARVRERVDGGVCVLGLRFTDDMAVPAERFERLRRELGDGFIGVEIDSSKDNPWGISPRAHSVLTEHLVDQPGHPTREALDQVLDFLRDRLVAPQ
jgi:dienelactone hydrolase